MAGSTSHSTGRYRKILLKNIVPWRRCFDEDRNLSIDGMPDILSEATGRPFYAVSPIDNLERLDRHHVIIGPDDEIWREGSLYLYRRATIDGLTPSCIAGLAGDLCDFANTLHENNMNMWVFQGPKIKRPTYFFKSVLKQRIIRNENCTDTCNRKLSAMIGFYRSESDRGYKPQQDMWVTNKKMVRYQDKLGYTHLKEVLSTDLQFKKPKSSGIDDGKYIIDGGKLQPIGSENQKHLMSALAASDNTEMLLMHIVALTGGPRIQTILTMRHSSINKAATEHGISLYGFDAGDGTLVDTKSGKKEYIALPEWVHHLITTYLGSKRYKERQAKSVIGTIEDQYIFLTKSGSPYYIASKDRALFNSSSEAGSAIRQFKSKTIDPLLKKEGCFFEYRFHDLRATFGMNLYEGLKKTGMSELAILDTIMRRLNHGSIEVTMRYLKFKPQKDQLAAAQSAYEEHLKSIVKRARFNHDSLDS